MYRLSKKRGKFIYDVESIQRYVILFTQIKKTKLLRLVEKKDNSNNNNTNNNNNNNNYLYLNCYVIKCNLLLLDEFVWCKWF